MPRFTEVYGLDIGQAELDFVDVETTTDNRLYLDPYAIQIREDEWSASCGDHIRSFFNAVLDALRSGDNSRVVHLLGNLHEPNETFLGQSRGKPSGRGVGRHKARDLANALVNSRAFTTGLLSDISEAELFIDGVGPDTISDLTTNILRGKLEEYTKDQCDLIGIATKKTAALPPFWSMDSGNWHSKYYDLPIVEGRPVLLVPKFSVRRRLSLNSQEFYNHHMIAFLQQEYLSAGGALVETFKNGARHVYKKRVKEAHPFKKDDLATFARDHRDVLELYKKLMGSMGPLDFEDFDDGFDERVYAQALIERLNDVEGGNKSASDYHRIAMGICTFLFYPHLIYPLKEAEINEGRKRIDIRYTNSAEEGFFLRMSQNAQTRAAYVMIECKNYTKEIANPELDQLSGRFSHRRGFFGILLCRTMEDRDKVTKSCKDAAADGRGYMMVLEDADLVTMLGFVAVRKRSKIDSYLQNLFNKITH